MPQSATGNKKSSPEDQHEVTLDEAVRLAQGHHLSGNFILAERTYRDILRAVPEHFKSTLSLGVLLFQTGDYEGSKQFLKRATELEPEDVNAWNNYGGVLTQIGEYELALEIFAKALALDPDHADALNNKACALWNLERAEESEEVSRRALELSPDDPTAYSNLGIALAKRSKFEESLDVWKKLTEIEPDNAKHWVNWGNTLREMGRIKESEEKCRKAVELDPRNPEALNNLANALRDMGKIEEAIDLYRQATNIRPEHYQSHNNLAIAYSDLNRFEEAAIAARYCVAFNNNFADGYCALSKALCELGEYPDAYNAAQRAIHIEPESASGYLHMADVLMRSDQLDDGEAVMQQAVKLEPDSPRSWLKLADMRERMNNFEEAHEAIDKAIEMSGNMPQLWSRKATIYHMDGDLEQALETIDKALEFSPDLLGALYNKAEMLVAVNRNEEALEYVRKVLSKNKHMPGAYQLLTTLKTFKSKEDEDFQNMAAIEENVQSMGQDNASAYHFAMARALEHMKAYEESFEHYKEANDLRWKSVPYNPQRSDETHKAIRRRFTAELIAEARESGSQSDVPVFIVGMPRSGTTLTEQILACHPDVLGAGELPEMGRVNRLAATGAMTGLAELGDEYVRRIREREPEGAKKALRITDKMPANYVHMGFIARILPNAKIIHCRRNPIDTCLSCYVQNFARGQYWSYNLEELAAEYKRYLGTMEHWRNVMPDRFIEVDYEETVNNFEAQARRLVDYIGLEWNDACLEPHKHKRAVLTASKAQVTKPIYKTSVEKWRRYEKQLQPLVRELLPDQVLPEEDAA